MSLTNPPKRYEEWLECLQALQDCPWEAISICDQMRKGVFPGLESSLLPSFQKRILNCVNQMLENAVMTFSHQCREALEVADFSMLDLLFKRLAVQIRVSLFFNELVFLPEEFRLSTKQSLQEKMTTFWNNTLNTLKHDALENGAPELEDTVEAIKRIQLFPN